MSKTKFITLRVDEGFKKVICGLAKKNSISITQLVMTAINNEYLINSNDAKQ